VRFWGGEALGVWPYTDNNHIRAIVRCMVYTNRPSTRRKSCLKNRPCTKTVHNTNVLCIKTGHIQKRITEGDLLMVSPHLGCKVMADGVSFFLLFFFDGRGDNPASPNSQLN